MSIIKNGATQALLLDNGAVGQIKVNNIMINQVVGNNLDGSFANIYLRTQSESGWLSHPLTGPQSNSRVLYSENSICWTGDFAGVTYQLQLILQDACWFWKVELSSPVPVIADLTYTQDLGLGDEGFVTSNEAYASQYLDHFIQQNDSSIIVASRQNQAQSNHYPYIQEGSFQKITSFSTDSFQFFGTEYKKTGIPIGLISDQLENQNKQYECGFTALRTEKMTLTTTKAETVFYAAYKENQPQGNNEILIDQNSLKEQFNRTSENTQSNYEQELKVIDRKVKTEALLQTVPFSDEELNKRFPRQLQTEKLDKRILSFFTDQGEHVVLPEKEKLQERLTGNIIMATNTSQPAMPVMASTQFMPGIFESQVVFGNTNMNVLSTHTRDALNYFKVTGTRIYLKIEKKYYLLAMPSAYAMNYDGADWYYKIKDDVIKVSADAAVTSNQLNLQFKSENQIKYDLIITTQWNNDSLGKNPQIKFTSSSVEIQPAADMLMAKRVPQVSYYIDYNADNDAANVQLGDETMLLIGDLEAATNQIVAQYQDVSSLLVRTSLTNEKIDESNTETLRQKHRLHYAGLLRNLKLETENNEKVDLIEQTNLILKWFAHDAMVHLLSPHGLEQYGGAAWGTRDVSQGPTEFFLSTGHYAEVRQIILKTYAHQFVENGNWPQWFMFDEYADQFADESHGDVIVWPLKVVTDYLLATNDLDILNELVPYLSLNNKEELDEKVTLLDHIQKQLHYIETHFLYDTFVSAYGDGDWDDTLQPADPKQKKQMASTWTEELTIETLRKATKVFKDIPELRIKVTDLADNMYRDFKKYFMQDDVLPGFIRMNPDHSVVPIIHPGDKITGIDYRLLPLSQGVLSHILKGNEVNHALNLISEHLLFPDGVRLMNKPSTYHGGTSQIFKRAEQAANFGREIGLLYVHAHIRYADAISTTGDKKRAWQLLQLVNPVQLQQRVKNAELRQANTYFSSSDGDFLDRYQASNDFTKLKTQEVGVKGGWRLYSSGPGIFIGTLISSILQIHDLETFNSKNKTLTSQIDNDIKITIDQF
ncbi:cyclic beta 1-2 glucan ligase [Lapidilactobacillus dextrinicus DSM 20335]|uniref:Cyclic beta 1-2 glucan ligase n=1 Tax=Lapidilactobacillus dextrinicus DSM 20335 TaxID=1423738 RepID=A0A0R2BJX7_9LACO|nr:hypothetical protein [Lapidilactobacillus dextrinicus]KRM79607.1 cyclic beta 1-2 glucan ligase [Lapidilactobacillus dextrinicus DSM 20335]QFG47397.1 cellobiose phosphorylase [Lapidilactobacillus dextrinicus]